MVTQIVTPGDEMKDAGEKGERTDKNEQAATFEEAISQAGQGWFQHRAVLCSGLLLYAVLCETTCVAYLLPAAECDLQMNLNEKGLLGSSVFVGFICSAHMWGAVGDVWGRRNTMIFALAMNVLCTVSSAFAPSFLPLLLLRFFSGFFSCAPSGLLYVYVGEFHSNAKRPRAVISAAALGAISMVSLPAIALWVIPSGWSFQVSGLPVLNSWRIFLAMCAIPGVAAALVLKFAMPESPKFLLERGRNEEALRVLQTIYASNSGRPKTEYPVRALVCEGAGGEEEHVSMLRTAWRQTAPLFGRELRGKTALVCLMQFAGFFGFNPLILWLPEMFNRMSVYAAGSMTLCDVMGGHDEVNSTLVLLEEGLIAAGDLGGFSPLQTFEYNVTSFSNVTCDPSVDDSAFINSLVLNAAAGVANICAGLAVNLMGKRYLLVTAFITSGSLTASLAYLRHPTLLLVLYCTGVALGCACPGIITAVAIDLFPTNLRGMATSLCMMCGRAGVVLGTMAFGALLEVRCELPFLMLSATLIGGGLIALKVPSKASSQK